MKPHFASRDALPWHSLQSSVHQGRFTAERSNPYTYTVSVQYSLYSIFFWLGVLFQTFISNHYQINVSFRQFHPQIKPALSVSPEPNLRQCLPIICPPKIYILQISLTYTHLLSLGTPVGMPLFCIQSI